ncbi:MAG: response regulator [Candidatus Zambryskibacteria bacterium]|nr:response regulator [Candidatus Zambryskibacteria bacterium]
MRHILLVEDNPTVRDLTIILLRRAGYFVRAVRDGQEAWELLEAGREFDLILSDNSMPRMTGLELLRRVRADQRTAEIPFILTSGAGAVSQNDRTPLETVCKNLSATFVLKPCYELERVVARVLRNRWVEKPATES